MKVWLKLAPGPISPLSQIPVFEVVVWFMESLLVQVTVSPTLIVTGVGLKAKFCIETETVAAARAPPPPRARKATSAAHPTTIVTPAVRSRPPLLNFFFRPIFFLLQSKRG